MTKTSLILPVARTRDVAEAVNNGEIRARAEAVHATEDATAERCVDFIGLAQSAREQLHRTGQGFDAHAVHRYIRDRLTGGRPVRPEASKWRG